MCAVSVGITVKCPSWNMKQVTHCLALASRWQTCTAIATENRAPIKSTGMPRRVILEQSFPTENVAEALGSQRVWVSTAPMFLTCCLGTEPRAGPVSNTHKWEIIQGDLRELQ